MTGHTPHMIQVAKNTLVLESLHILLVVQLVTLYVVGVVKCLIHECIVFISHTN